jgi:hypothetical protein
MKKFVVMAFLGIAALAQMPAEAANQPIKGGTILPWTICSPGYSWQYGCLKWGKPKPGQLFGACLKQGWGCLRSPQRTQ